MDPRDSLRLSNTLGLWLVDSFWINVVADTLDGQQRSIMTTFSSGLDLLHDDQDYSMSRQDIARDIQALSSCEAQCVQPSGGAPMKAVSYANRSAACFGNLDNVSN